MFTMVTESTRRTVSAVAAVAVVVLAGLALDQGHHGALRQGVVEVGQLGPVSAARMTSVTLPEITVVAERTDAARLAQELPRLPGIVVVGDRPVQLAAAAVRVTARG